MPGDPNALLVQPGFLAWGATDLALPFPHGGVDLGFTDDGLRVVPKLGRLILKGEESGMRILQVRYLDVEATLFATLLQWNDDTVARAFPGGLTAVGTSSGTRVVQLPGTLLPGARPPAAVLVFSPLDTATNKVVLVRRAVPMLTEAATINFKLKDQTKLEVVFYCEEDTTIATTSPRYPTRILGIGPKADLAIA